MALKLGLLVAFFNGLVYGVVFVVTGAHPPDFTFAYQYQRCLEFYYLFYQWNAGEFYNRHQYSERRNGSALHPV